MVSWLLCALSARFLYPTTTRTFHDIVPEANRTLWWSPTGSYRSPHLKGFEIHQGDILVPVNENWKNAIKSKAFLWKDGIIPYEFSENITETERIAIIDAMTSLQEKTCVKFVENDGQETFIRFQNEKNGCYAPIGRIPGNDGPLPVNFQSPECFKEKGIIQHELLHVMGLFHEQARPDRDDHVVVHWCNIQPNRENDFLKGTDDLLETFDLPYDFASLMHYPKWAFSKNGKPTITAKSDPDMTLGQRKGPSPLDLEKIIKMYKCQK